MTDMPQTEIPQEDMPQETRWEDPAELGLRPDMLVEVMTSDNYLAFLGKVDSIKDGAVILRDNRGNELPQVMYNREMRLSFKREGETTMIQLPDLRLLRRDLEAGSVGEYVYQGPALLFPPERQHQHPGQMPPALLEGRGR